MVDAVGLGTAIGGLIFLFVFLWILIAGLAIFALVFWILMIVDVAQRKFKNKNDSIMWILIIIFTGIIGALIYYFVVKKYNKH